MYIPGCSYQTVFRTFAIKDAAHMTAYFSSDSTVTFEWDDALAFYEGSCNRF